MDRKPEPETTQPQALTRGMGGPWEDKPASCGATGARWGAFVSMSGRRRENMVGVNMVGVSNVVHDAICECSEGIMLEPCLLQPCFHVAGVGSAKTTVTRSDPNRRTTRSCNSYYNSYCNSYCNSY